MRLEQRIEFERIIHDQHQRTGEVKYFTNNTLQELRDANGITEKGIELEKRKIEIKYKGYLGKRNLEKLTSNTIVFTLAMLISIILFFSGGAGWL